ncbi:MAG: urocanate hydratase, partial [Elusimicrobiota bacterium]|nr:urocanate hydratase [Elusimicrobiota bacterium]
MTLEEFRQDIRAGISDVLPPARPYDAAVSHAPRRKNILTPAQKELTLKNALRYFPAKHHKILAAEFARELKD